MKAKRSLTSSFDHLLKRKNSKDDVAIAQKEQATSKALAVKSYVSRIGRYVVLNGENKNQ